MSSKPPKASRAELVEAKVIREEDFALEAWRNRVPYPEMRRLALVELGYALSESALRGLVQSARARHGDTMMTRADRIDRQQAEIDERAQRARYDLARAHREANRPMPARAEFAELGDWDRAVIAWAKAVESAMKAVESADRRLAAAMKDEREIYGDNAATKIEAEVTTRDAVTEELNAMLARLGVDETIEEQS